MRNAPRGQSRATAVGHDYRTVQFVKTSAVLFTFDKNYGIIQLIHLHLTEECPMKKIILCALAFLFVFLITVVLNIGVEVIGEEQLANFILNRPVLGPVFAGMIGLLPNCAASVVITQMFLDGLMSFGTMMAGLLVGAGVGILVLLRVNEDKTESFKIIGALYFVGVLGGIFLNAF